MAAQQSGVKVVEADFGARDQGYEADNEGDGPPSDSEEEDSSEQQSDPEDPPAEALREEQEGAEARQAEEERLRAEEEACVAEAERLRLEEDARLAEEARLAEAARVEAKKRQPAFKERLVRLRENATEEQKTVFKAINAGLSEAVTASQWRLLVERMNAADRTLNEIEAEIQTFLPAKAEADAIFSERCAKWAVLKSAYTNEMLARLQESWGRQEDRSFAAHRELLAESSAQHRDFLHGRDMLRERFKEISEHRNRLEKTADEEQKARLVAAHTTMMSRAKAGYLDEAFALSEDFRRLMEDIGEELEQERQLVMENLLERVESGQQALESLNGALIEMEREELAARLDLARKAAEGGEKAACENALAALQEQLDRSTGQQELATELLERQRAYPARVEDAETHAKAYPGLVAAITRVWEEAGSAPAAQDWDGLQKALDTLDTLLETLRAWKAGEAEDEAAARQQAEQKKQLEQAQKAAAQAAKVAQRQAEVAAGKQWGDGHIGNKSALLQKIWAETKNLAGTHTVNGGISRKYPLTEIMAAIEIWHAAKPPGPGLTGMHVPGKSVQDKSHKPAGMGQNAGRRGSEGCFISTWHGVNYNIHVKVAGT